MADCGKLPNLRYQVFAVCTVFVVVLFVESQKTIRLSQMAESHELKWNSRLTDQSNDTGQVDMVMELLKPRQEPEVCHIGFLKVHKAASSTVQNIVYRFGLKRNLSFVLPRPGHYLAKTKYSYNPVLPSFRKDNGKYDILCNHVRFNIAKFREFLHKDAVYIAIVRDPLELFVSAAYYYKFVWNFDYLAKLNKDSFIHDLIVEPEKWETSNIQDSYTFNSLANDFGYEFNSLQDVMKTSDERINDFVLHISCTFKYVMVMERFEESLVLLKRLLHWQLQDILFLDLNKYLSGAGSPKKVNISEADKRTFRKRNLVDYKIYEYFYRQFEEKLAQEYRISDEVEHFGSVLKEMHTFCSSEKNVTERLHVNSSVWNSEFVVDKRDCDLMSTPELEMFRVMKTKHMALLSTKN